MPYSNKIHCVVEAITTHPDQRLTLHQLSQMSGVSAFHLHRLFRSETGMTIGKFCTASKLRRAAHQLLFRPWLSITDIALDNAYQSLEAFSRAFVREYHITPSGYRQQSQLSRTNALPTSEDSAMQLSDVKVVQFAAVDVYELVHRGPPTELTASIQQFIQWRKSHKLGPQTSRTFNIFYNDPESVAPAEFIFGLAAEKVKPLNSSAPLQPRKLPACRCAHLRHIGPESQLEHALQFLYRDWLGAVNETPGDLPLFAERVSFFPEVPEQAMITDLYLPLKD